MGAHFTSAPPSVVFRSIFTVFLISGFNLEGNVGIDALPTKFIQASDIKDSIDQLVTGAQFCLGTAPAMNNAWWGALLEAEQCERSLLLVSPVCLLGSHIVAEAGKGDSSSQATFLSTRLPTASSRGRLRLVQFPIFNNFTNWKRASFASLDHRPDATFSSH